MQKISRNARLTKNDILRLRENKYKRITFA